MVALEDQVTVLEKEIYGLNKENELQNRVFSKFEETLEKLQTLTEALHRLIIQHEERIKVTSENVVALRLEMKDELEELEKRLHAENANLCKKFTESEERILSKLSELSERKDSAGSMVAALAMKFDAYKYFILGGVFIAGLLLGKGNWISGLFTLIPK